MERALLPIKNKDSIIHRKEKILKTGACACILFEQICKRYSIHGLHITTLII